MPGHSPALIIPRPPTPVLRHARPPPRPTTKPCLESFPFPRQNRQWQSLLLPAPHRYPARRGRTPASEKPVIRDLFQFGRLFFLCLDIIVVL